MRKGTGGSVTRRVVGDLDVWWVWALAAGEGEGMQEREGRRHWIMAREIWLPGRQ